MRYSFIFLLISNFCFAQTSLVPGDIAIVHYNSDNPDEFSFVCLRTIDSGTLIFFTDNGWLSSGAFRASEGTISWHAQRPYSCGEVVLIDSIAPISLSATGDQLLAYQGSSSSPSFITAFNNEDTAVWQSTASNANNSALPSSLTNGVNAVAVHEIDNIIYSDTLSGSLASLKQKLFDATSYAGHNSNRLTFNSNFNVISGCILPVHLVRFEIVVIGDVPVLEWSTAMEYNSYYYEIESSYDARQFKTIAQIPAAGTSHSLLNYEYALESDLAKYYRLKEVDFDGSETYSDVISYHTKCTEPTLSYSLLHWHVKAQGEIELSVYDLGGRLLAQCVQVDLIKFSFADLHEGIYLLGVKSENRMNYFKAFASY